MAGKENFLPAYRFLGFTMNPLPPFNRYLRSNPIGINGVLFLFSAFYYSILFFVLLAIVQNPFVSVRPQRAFEWRATMLLQ
ncbi:MAG: hypothetical protein IJW54_06095 [Clostridia bacterium]|nr:hypothetical protein [Clostridia bacterium]